MTPTLWRITDGEGGYTYYDEKPSAESIAWVERYGRKVEGFCQCEEDAQAPVAIPKGYVSVEALCGRLNQYPIPTKIGVTAIMKLIQEVADAAPTLPAAQEKEA
jgi:hypothetical protein